ncbi:MAG: hypothetical protein ACYC6N_20905 [Pirellulaceae bacterium]
MSWIVEEPLYIVILGVVTLAFLTFAWMQTGFRWLLHATLGVGALTIGLLVLERLVETEPELIDATLRQIGRDVERNDLDAVLGHVYSGAPETLRMAQSEFPRYSFKLVNIKHNVEVQLHPDAAPPMAEVTFNVVLDVTERNSEIRHPRVALFVRLTLRKEKGAWKVAKYDYDAPQRSLLDPREH